MLLDRGSAGAEPKQLKILYPTGKVSLLSGNVVKRRLQMYLSRNSRNEIQVLQKIETSAINKGRATLHEMARSIIF